MKFSFGISFKCEWVMDTAVKAFRKYPPCCIQQHMWCGLMKVVTSASKERSEWKVGTRINHNIINISGTIMISFRSCVCVRVFWSEA